MVLDRVERTELAAEEIIEEPDIGEFLQTLFSDIACWKDLIDLLCIIYTRQKMYV